jgi:hypothetical protein
VLTGTGAHGAYQAGVLRALQEAGVKIDLLAGQGIGAGSAALAAIDGTARLWEGNGIWRSPRIRQLYGWRRPVRLAAAAGVAAAMLLIGGLILALAGISKPILTWTLLAALSGAIAMLSVALRADRLGGAKRRAYGPWWWRLAGAPLDAAPAHELFAGTIWDLIRGAAPLPRPERGALGRRYAEALQESLGQPGFSELLLVATDLDARRDTVAALLREPYRTEFLAPRPDRDRRSEVVDLAGIGRDHAIDMMAAAMTPPVLCPPELVTFAADGYWRGETHRLCDRPGAIHRLLEETAAAGVTQVIVVSAISSASSPHRLRVPRVDVASRLGEFQAGAEAAALRDALEMARLRLDFIHVISPPHNPVGPFDVGGAYDDASDRRQELTELMQRGYEDAYRQFIEPVVGASGEHLASATAAVRAPAEISAGRRAPAPASTYGGRDTLFDDPALPD